MGKDFGVTFLGLWWAEFHAEKEMGAKMVGLPGSAVSIHKSMHHDGCHSQTVICSHCSHRSIVVEAGFGTGRARLEILSGHDILKVEISSF